MDSNGLHKVRGTVERAVFMVCDRRAVQWAAASGACFVFFSSSTHARFLARKSTQVVVSGLDWRRGRARTSAASTGAADERDLNAGDERRLSAGDECGRGRTSVASTGAAYERGLGSGDERGRAWPQPASGMSWASASWTSADECDLDRCRGRARP